MILRYAANLKLAKELYDSSKPKLQGSQEMIDTFKNVFGLPEKSVKLAGTVEATLCCIICCKFLKQKYFSFRFYCNIWRIRRCSLQTL